MSDFVYRIREAANPKERSPVIFLLHGYGSHADDLFSFAPYLPENHAIIALQAPLSLPFGGFAWYSINIDVTAGKWSDDDEARKAIEMLLTAIPNLCQKHHLDTQDITLFGFSQGAILSWAIGLDHPHLIRRVVALSGYVNWDIIKTSMETIEEVPQNLCCSRNRRHHYSDRLGTKFHCSIDTKKQRYCIPRISRCAHGVTGKLCKAVGVDKNYQSVVYMDV